MTKQMPVVQNTMTRMTLTMFLLLQQLLLPLLLLSPSSQGGFVVVVDAQGFNDLDDTIACNLCEDGSPLPNPNMDMGRNQTCQTLQQDFRDEGEYICIRVQGKSFGNEFPVVDDSGHFLLISV